MLNIWLTTLVWLGLLGGPDPALHRCFEGFEGVSRECLWWEPVPQLDSRGKEGGKEGEKVDVRSGLCSWQCVKGILNADGFSRQRSLLLQLMWKFTDRACRLAGTRLKAVVQTCCSFQLMPYPQSGFHCMRSEHLSGCRHDGRLCAAKSVCLDYWQLG